jgi:S1-C subfamily serine protease
VADNAYRHRDKECNMAGLSDWKVSPAVQPKPEDYPFDLDQVLSAVVGVRAIVPSDAFTAETLGTERTGNGVLIRSDGLVLTVGYLVTEAESIWLTLIDGRAVPATVLGYDQATGFGLVQALARLDLPAVELGDSGAAQIGQRVVIGGAGGRQKSVSAKIVAKQEFAGYWEYVVDQALFTAPSHPHWGGTAVIGPKGDLIGIGSLQLQEGREQGPPGDLNMVIPIDLLKPVLDDLLTLGRPKESQRPWLGLYATEIEDKIVVVGLAKDGPAQRADLRTGDVVLSVAGDEVNDLATFYRKIWSLGGPGVDVPLSVYREGSTFDVRLKSSDRHRFLKTPRLH